MDDQTPQGDEHTESLAREFDTHRARLRGVAYRILGTYADADDAIQEAWLRLSRSDDDAIDNLGGWLTTVVSRVCLDMLRTRRRRDELPVDDLPVDPTPAEHGDSPAAVVEDPESLAVQADSVGAALLVVLDTLSPAERLAFVLHDLFGVPFEQIAPVLERTPAAARQLASRARRRVRGAPVPGARAEQRPVVQAFIRAAREGDVAGLLEVLDPAIELRADRVAVETAAAAPAAAPRVSRSLQGAQAVAAAFRGTAQGAELALIDGVIGAVYAPGGSVVSAIGVRVRNGRITMLDICADPDTIAGMQIELLGIR